MPLKNSVLIYSKAFGAVCGCRNLVEEVANLDFELPPDANISEVQMEHKRRDSRETSIRRCRSLRKRLMCAFVLLATAGLTAVCIWAVWLNHHDFRSPLSGIFIGGSIFAFAWATLGKLGWGEGSFGGRTIFERLDDVIFRALYWIGTLLGFLGFLA